MSCHKYLKYLEGLYGRLNSTLEWDKLYNVLNERAMDLYEDKAMNVALSPGNFSRNRYCNVFPYDDSRVSLHDVENSYINASLVKFPDLKTSYICCQGPLKVTVDDFWLMVWQQHCRIILMLNNLREKGREKCYKYYSDNNDQVVDGDQMKLIFQSEEIVSSQFVKRHYELLHKRTGLTRHLTQYHYISWPDFGVPESPDDFLALLRDVRYNESQQPGSDLIPPPIVVHCSAGLGRSGTYCLVDAVFNKMELFQSIEVDLCDVLTYMRKYRSDYKQYHPL